MIKRNNVNVKVWISQNIRCHYWLALPREWYNYFNTDDFEWIAKIHKEFRKLSSSLPADAAAPTRSQHRTRYSFIHARSNFRKTLRARRNGEFADGMYIVRTATVWLDPAGGKYNIDGGWSSYNYNTHRPRKGAILMWIETDELDRQIFMWNNTMWSCHGSYLDGISKI
jgi:hypothetical protein